jgi:hypothetical protein
MININFSKQEAIHFRGKRMQPITAITINNAVHRLTQIAGEYKYQIKDDCTEFTIFPTTKNPNLNDKYVAYVCAVYSKMQDYAEKRNPEEFKF